MTFYINYFYLKDKLQSFIINCYKIHTLKIKQSHGLFGKLTGPVMKPALPLVINILLHLNLTAAVLDACIPKKIRGSQTTTLVT